MRMRNLCAEIYGHKEELKKDLHCGKNSCSSAKPLLVNAPPSCAPLRLTGGGDSSFDCLNNIMEDQENGILEKKLPTSCSSTMGSQGNDLSVNDLSINTPPARVENISLRSPDILDMGDKGNGHIVNLSAISTPLRPTGECQENVNLAGQKIGLNENFIADSNCSIDVRSFINQDNSMSEQDIRDVLFEAGYTMDAINEIITSKAGTRLNESASDTLNNESVSSESESGINSAYEVLREIRVKNVNKVVIGSLNINSLASKFEQLREIIGKNLDILTIVTCSSHRAQLPDF